MEVHRLFVFSIDFDKRSMEVQLLFCIGFDKRPMQEHAQQPISFCQQVEMGGVKKKL